MGTPPVRASAGELFPPQEAIIGHVVVVALAAQVDMGLRVSRGLSLPSGCGRQSEIKSSAPFVIRRCPQTAIMRVDD